MALWVDALDEVARDTTLQGVNARLDDLLARIFRGRVKVDKAGGDRPRYVWLAPNDPDGTPPAITAAAGTVMLRITRDVDGDATDVQVIEDVPWGANTAARDALAWLVD